MSSFKRSQHKYVKKAYRVRNWREYEAGLRDRGNLTVWIALTDGELANWDAPRLKNRKPGRQRKYSDHAIDTAVTLSMVLGLASRPAASYDILDLRRCNCNALQVQAIFSPPHPLACLCRYVPNGSSPLSTDLRHVSIIGG